MIKQYSICVLLMLAGITLRAQQRDHVKWVYSLTKSGDGGYALHLQATMDEGWHIYAQVQPESSVSVPCSFTFHADSTYHLVGKVREIGKLIRFQDAASGLSANEYAGTVDFVQRVQFGSAATRTVSGELTYQACSDGICLLPQTIPFSIR